MLRRGASGARQENASNRYGVRPPAQSPRIDSGQLPTNPSLDALGPHRLNHRISAGFIVEDAPASPSVLRHLTGPFHINVSGVAELCGWRGSCCARDVTAGKLAWRARQGPEAATPQLCEVGARRNRLIA